MATYLERVEFAAHFFAGATFALLGIWTAIGWVVWTLIDEFVVDGWKGKEQGYDTLVDLGAKLAVPIGALIWTLSRLILTM